MGNSLVLACLVYQGFGALFLEVSCAAFGVAGKSPQYAWGGTRRPSDMSEGRAKLVCAWLVDRGLDQEGLLHSGQLACRQDSQNFRILCYQIVSGSARGWTRKALNILAS